MAAAVEAPGVPRAPRVSIGIPVFNGEKYLALTLDAVAAQSYDDYELILCDNASTDRTREICLERAARDPRIRYHRNPTNIGGDLNYNRCIELAKGTYFLGLGYDDLLRPDYLARTVEVLDNDPTAVFCHSRAFRMDATGKIFGLYEPHVFSSSASPSQRLSDAIHPSTYVVVCLGLLRLETLRQTPLLRPHPFADAFLQADLALRGRLHEVPEFLITRRFPAPTVSIYERAVWSDPRLRGAIVFPHWRRLGEYVDAIFRVPLTFGERVRCLGQVAKYARAARVAKSLFRDLRMSLRALVLRTPVGPALQSLARRTR